MTRRGVLIGAVLGLLALPALVVLVDAAMHFFANRTSGTIVSSGNERQYILHVPKSYDPAGRRRS